MPLDERRVFERRIQPPHRRSRTFFDASLILTLASLLVAAGMSWQQFIDNGKHLALHDSEIQTLTVIAQQQQVTAASTAQAVADIKADLERDSNRQ
jgi:hypothetical protein